MSKFMYFENTEGGMWNFFVDSEDDLEYLYGWKNPDCIDKDIALLDWMRHAEIGEFHNHRLGVIVRLKSDE